jgi:hypothetical protein
MELLKRFYQDEHTRNAVKEFLVQCLKEKAVELAFGGRSTAEIKQASEVIDEAWNKLDRLYGKKEEKNKENPAR